MNNEVFASNLMRIRKEKGLSSKAVARMLEVDEDKYVGWEMGIEAPTTKEIIQIAEAFSMDYSDLIAEPQYIAPTKQQPAYAVAPAQKVQQPKQPKQPKIVPQRTTFQWWGAITLTVLAAVLLIFYVMTVINIGGGEYFDLDGKLMWYDLFKGDAGLKAIMSLLLIIPCWFIVDAIIKMAAKPLRVNMYSKITNIINIVLAGGMVVICAVFGGLYGRYYDYWDEEYRLMLSWGYFIVAALIAAIAVIAIINANNNLRHKLTKKVQAKLEQQ